MEDSTNEESGNGTRQSNNSANRTRTVDRTSNQKITIPTLDKHDSTSAKLWWRRFTQYIKMTRDIDLKEMANDKEIFEDFRELLDREIKDIFVWAIGEAAVSEMTKTIRERDPTSLPLHKLYSLFRIHFIPERNIHHSRADFFNIKRENGESAADVWKRILEIEKKCEFENITPAELIASKFLSLIGKSSGDYELKRKIKKSNMTIDAITEAIHEHMYEKLNETTDSNETREIRQIKERKRFKRVEEKNTQS